MSEYRVRWCIDIEADTAREAAAKALSIQRDVFSDAVVFQVVPARGGHEVEIDLCVEEQSLRKR
jgi:hypothetical protein